MMKKNYDLFKNLSQLVAAIFLFGLIMIIIFIDNYKTPSWLVLASILVAIAYWFGIGFFKVEQKSLPIYSKKKLKVMYIILILIVFFIWTIIFVISIIKFKIYPSKVSDIITIVTIIITLSTEFTTYSFNRLLLHKFSK